VEAHESEEGHVIGGGVKAVVMCKLGCGEVAGPVVLTDGSIGSEILLEGLVDMLGLTIGLRVISSRHGLFNTEEGTEAAKESRSKLGAAIGDQFRRETEESPDVVTI